MVEFQNLPLFSPLFLSSQSHLFSKVWLVNPGDHVVHQCDHRVGLKCPNARQPASHVLLRLRVLWGTGPSVSPPPAPKRVLEEGVGLFVDHRTVHGDKSHESQWCGPYSTKAWSPLRWRRLLCPVVSLEPWKTFVKSQLATQVEYEGSFLLGSLHSLVLFNSFWMSGNFSGVWPSDIARCIVVHLNCLKWLIASSLKEWMDYLPLPDIRNVYDWVPCETLPGKKRKKIKQMLLNWPSCVDLIRAG